MPDYAFEAAFCLHKISITDSFWQDQIPMVFSELKFRHSGTGITGVDHDFETETSCHIYTVEVCVTKNHHKHKLNHSSNSMVRMVQIPDFYQLPYLSITLHDVDLRFCTRVPFHAGLGCSAIVLQREHE